MTKPQSGITDSAIRIGETSVSPGQRSRIELPVSRLSTETWLSVPVEVVNGKYHGPRLWISAAIHGDELNGIEIIRQVLEIVKPDELHGAVVAVPIVNVFGFLQQERYLPDRRDLNRSFPGSATGSLAARLAHLFMIEIVKKCTHGIDLHTGSNFRTNHPQIRANLNHDETRRCAEAFAAPLLIHSQTRDGSLRAAAAKLEMPTLLYEAGEPLRFEANSIQVGVAGVLQVMNLLGMRNAKPKRNKTPPIVIGKTTWLRAKHSGILRLETGLGNHVRETERVGIITNAFGDKRGVIKSSTSGVVIGMATNPIVNRGDAVVHVGIQESQT